MTILRGYLKKGKYFAAFLAALSLIPVVALADGNIPFCSIRVGGELYARLERNFQRLHEDKYQPQRLFLSEEESGYWPGDTEGRTLLALVMDAQALGQEPLYLERIIQQLPAHLNQQGYMGTVYRDVVSEQQLSGNGWLLRGLCEYYEWKADRNVLPVIKSISQNLFVKAKGMYSHYPIRPEQRLQNVGEASGTLQNTVDGWLLSSDIGCVFIGMDGLIQAYQYVGTKEMRGVIEEMIQRFLSIDLVAVKAQTHATLTACRALVRWGDLTGDDSYYKEAESRWQLYKEQGMTPNFENYNWFGRQDTWTEPCAIVDSYMLAIQLWKRTGKAVYRDDAELIYYNAICRTQRINGGFGCDTCPNDSTGVLGIHEPEAHWCCTMRGGEGLSRAAAYSYQLCSDTLVVPFFRESRLLMTTGEGGVLSLEQATNYPFDGQVTFAVKENTSDVCTLSIPCLPWASDYQFRLNGTGIIPPNVGGFYVVDAALHEGDSLTVSFVRQFYDRPLSSGRLRHRYFCGPLLLGADADNKAQLSPIYHLMQPQVWDKNYQLQILF